MRTPSARCLSNTVTVRRATYGNVRGVRTATYADAIHQASVQAGSGADGDAHLQELGATAYRVYFASDPGCKAGDLIVWGTRTLSVVAVPSDRAGKGAAFRVDCTEVD